MKKALIVFMVGILIVGVAGMAFASSENQEQFIMDIDQMPEECVEQMEYIEENCHGPNGMMQSGQMQKFHKQMMGSNINRMMMGR